MNLDNAEPNIIASSLKTIKTIKTIKAMKNMINILNTYLMIHDIVRT